MSKKARGTFILVCGVISLIISVVFGILGLMGMEMFSEDMLCYLILIVVDAYLIYLGIKLRKTDE